MGTACYRLGRPEQQGCGAAGLSTAVHQRQIVLFVLRSLRMVPKPGQLETVLVKDVKARIVDASELLAKTQGVAYSRHLPNDVGSRKAGVRLRLHNQLVAHSPGSFTRWCG